MTKQQNYVILLLFIVTLTACNRAAQRAIHDNHEIFFGVVYQTDSRKNVGFNQDDYPPSLQSSATVFLLYKKEIPRVPYTLGEAQPLLCSDERFLNEPVVGFCSGVLIAPNQVLTAGHCIKNKSECEEAAFIFGHTYESSQQRKLSQQKIYTCDHIVSRELKGAGKYSIDYAVIQLDREVEGVTPVRVASNTTPSIGEQVISMSYPLGLPLKQDIGVVAEADKSSNQIMVEVDTFKGSSGSPLFNKAGELLGILTNGSDDLDEDEVYEARRNGGCYNFRRCNKSAPGSRCMGETYFKASVIPL